MMALKTQITLNKMKPSVIKVHMEPFGKLNII